MRKDLLFFRTTGCPASSGLFRRDAAETECERKSGRSNCCYGQRRLESGPGQSLRSILAVDFPFLPQREPLFTMFNIQENAFSSIFQIHRNIIMATPTPICLKPKW